MGGIVRLLLQFVVHSSRQLNLIVYIIFFVSLQATPAVEGAVEKIQELASNAAGVVSSALGLNSDEKASTDAASTTADSSAAAPATAAADASSDASTNGTPAAAVLAEGTTDAEPAAGKQVVDVMVSAPVTAGEVAPQG
jgi:hypothetical protein